MSFFNWLRKTDKSKLSEKITDDSSVQTIIKEAMEGFTDKIDKGEYYFQKGNQAAQYKDYEGAISNFNKSLEYFDPASVVYLNRGAIFQMQERFLDARDDYLKVIETENNDKSENYKENVTSAEQNLATITQFCAFNDKQGEVVRNQIKDDGIDYAAKRFGEVICDMMKNNGKLIHQFILEELEELDELGGDKLAFVLSTGVERQEYSGAVDSENHHSMNDTICSFFKSLLCCLSRNPQQMFEFRASLLTQIMKKHGIGKY